MTKNSIITLIILGVIVIGGSILLANLNKSEMQANNIPVSNENDSTIRKSVSDFGGKLKNVSLLTSSVDLKKSMSDNYSIYLTPELLSEWQNDPTKALGRKVSSPWPDRIDVVSVNQVDADTYNVEGNVIEVSSNDKPGEASAVYPVTFGLVKSGNSWLIEKASKGAYSELPKRISISGLWECLPHVDQTGPQTDECALGLAADQSDAHYAIDTRLMSATIDFGTRTHVRVEGVLTPSNQISSDMWKKYPIDGIISATSITKI